MKENTTYSRRLAKGLCGQCGKRPPREGKTQCKECAENRRQYQLENRAFYIKQGLCPKCGKNRLFGDEKNCPECLARNEKVNIAYRIRKSGSCEEFNKQYYQETKKRLAEQNLCVMCKKNKRANGHVHCEECLEKRRIKGREIRKKQKKVGITRSERPTYGLCYCCGKPLDREGKKCIKCAAKATNNLPRIKATEHWKKDNNLIFVGGKQDDKIQK